MLMMRWDVPIFPVRLPEPVRQHAILGNAIEHAVRSHDGRVHGAREDQRSDGDDERMKGEPQPERAGQAHGQAADQILQIFAPHAVGNDHDGEKRYEGSEEQAVDENNQARFFQIRKLGSFDFAIHLRERFFAAHRQDGMSDADKHGDHGNHAHDLAAVKPAERPLVQLNIGRRRKRRKVCAANPNGVRAPHDQDDHHHRGDLHDFQGLIAGFMHALYIFPPEKKRDQYGEKRGRRILRKHDARVKVGEELVEEPGQVLPRGYAADRAGQNVVEHQRRNGEFRERSSQRFLDHAVDAPAHEHAAAFHVHRAHAVGEQHHAKNEPGRGLPDETLGFAPGVVGGGRQVVQNNGRRAPEGNERQHGRRGHNDARYGY